MGWGEPMTVDDAIAENDRLRAEMEGAMSELGEHYPHPTAMYDEVQMMCQCGDVFPCATERAHLILRESLRAGGLR